MNMTFESMKASLENYTSTRTAYANEGTALAQKLQGVTDSAIRRTIVARIAQLDNEIRGCNEMIRTLASHIYHTEEA